MNYHLLFSTLKGTTIRLAVTGAKGGFGRTLLAQCRHIPSIRLVALCDLDTSGLQKMLETLGMDAGRICTTAFDVAAAVDAGKTALIADYSLLAACALDMVVEATGQPEISFRIAADALSRGVHVGMVSKETESVAGPYLSRLARENGAVYTTLDGDQPSNLIGLVSWAEILGLEVIAAGKSSEYDFVYNPDTKTLTYTDQSLIVPELDDLWHLGEDRAAGLAARSTALATLPQSTTPDYCEMCVVSNSTGLLPSRDALSYPLCRTSELADIFIPVEDGGILEKTGVVDVFNALRLPWEPSFGGGVFVIVRCTDAETWEILRDKGHMVSKNGKYACLYLPYHIMGVETPLSIFSAVLHGRESGARKVRAHSVMIAHTMRDFKKGALLTSSGHHHAIDGLIAHLVPSRPDNKTLAPFYLAANRRLRVDVPKGTSLSVDMLDLDGSALYEAWRQ